MIVIWCNVKMLSCYTVDMVTCYTVDIVSCYTVAMLNCCCVSGERARFSRPLALA